MPWGYTLVKSFFAEFCPTFPIAVALLVNFVHSANSGKVKQSMATFSKDEERKDFKRHSFISYVRKNVFLLYFS